jgi:hypothetical protein
MDNKDKIELTIRAAVIARTILQLTDVNSKTQSRLIFADVICQIRELDGKIDTLTD